MFGKGETTMNRIDEGGLKLGCCSTLTMSDTQFEAMPEKMRRNLFERVYFVKTPKYQYALGANGNWWILCRRDRNANCEVVKDETGAYVLWYGDEEVVDRWR